MPLAGHFTLNILRNIQEATLYHNISFRHRQYTLIAFCAWFKKDCRWLVIKTLFFALKYPKKCQNRYVDFAPPCLQRHRRVCWSLSQFLINSAPASTVAAIEQHKGSILHPCWWIRDYWGEIKPERVRVWGRFWLGPAFPVILTFQGNQYDTEADRGSKLSFDCWCGGLFISSVIWHKAEPCSPCLLPSGLF